MCQDCDIQNKMFNDMKKVIAEYATKNEVHPMNVLDVLYELQMTLSEAMEKSLIAAKNAGMDITDIYDVKFTYAGVTPVQDDFVPKITDQMDDEFNNIIFTPIKKKEAN